MEFCHLWRLLIKHLVNLLILFSCYFYPGLQIIFPQYLQEKFVQSALSYIMCNGEGEYVCQNSQCRCQCAEEFPQCNCPITDIQIMEFTLANMAKAWTEAYKDLENSGTQKTSMNYPGQVKTAVRGNSIMALVSVGEFGVRCNRGNTHIVSTEWKTVDIRKHYAYMIHIISVGLRGQSKTENTPLQSGESEGIAYFPESLFMCDRCIFTVVYNYELMNEHT